MKYGANQDMINIKHKIVVLKMYNIVYTNIKGFGCVGQTRRPTGHCSLVCTGTWTDYNVIYQYNIDIVVD